MKQLSDFNLSIVIPLYKQMEVCKRFASSEVRYYERNGIEVVMVIDASIERKVLSEYLRSYPFICWKVVVSSETLLREHPAKAYNLGIRQATKQYVLTIDPEQLFYTDIVYEWRELLDSYPEHYATGPDLSLDIREEIDGQILKKHRDEGGPCASMMVKKEYLERVGGYDECGMDWSSGNENLRRRLELAGIRRLLFPDSRWIRRGDFSRIGHGGQLARISRRLLSEIGLPTKMNPNGSGWGNCLKEVAYDWKEHPFAKQQCRNYLSTLKAYEMASEDVFEKSYPLIALIPAYNESERIAACLQSVEKYCDGIILLDDDSTDGTYQTARSEKLLVKAQKQRTEFNDKQNRNLLLDIAHFFKAEWFIFVDADERFDDRFVEVREVMKKPDVDTVGVWIANAWDSEETYRTDMEDANPYSKNGVWFRWRMFRNKGRMQFRIHRTLHFTALPYWEKNRSWISQTLLIHLGYLENEKRLAKYNFYQTEDREKLLNYSSILHEDCGLANIRDIKSANLEV